MKTKKLTFLLALTFLFLFGCQTSGGNYNQDLQRGFDAIKRGDHKTAYRLWKPLAEQGNVAAQNNLGLMYVKGEGVPQDYNEAIRLFSLSAEQGFAEAQYHLGVLYQQGYGVPKDYKEAVRLYRLSAEQGGASGQLNLGAMYYNGHGVLQDYALAHMWFNLSGSNGNEDAVGNINFIEKKMSPQQIEKAQQLARNWKLRYEDQLKRQAYEDQLKRQAYEDQQKRQELRQAVKQFSEGLTQFGEEQRRRNNTNAYKYKPPTLSYDSNTSSGYRSSFGSTYEYDLSKPLDRQRYRVDPKAKLRDRLGINPQRRIERNTGQYGGGVLNNNKGAQW